jgi:hypothetical protein
VLGRIAARMGGGRASSCTPTRRGSSTARTATAGESTSTSPSPSWGSPSDHGRRSTARSGSSSPRSRPRSAPRRSSQRRPAPRDADPPAHRPDAQRPGGMAEPERRRVDALLRPVLPVGARSPPAARQLLPEALGWEQVQAAASPQTVPTMVGSDSRIASPAYSPTGSGPARTSLNHSSSRTAAARESSAAVPPSVAPTTW